MIHTQLRCLAAAAAGLVLAASARADVKPHALFTDGAVLQQGMPVPVWGTADDGEQVTVRFQGQEVQTTAKDGRWLVRLLPLKAGGGPGELTIRGNNTVTVKDVLVGEVWVASGQSNMEWSVNQSADPEKVKAGADRPKIRLFSVPKVGADKPRRDVKAKWVVCSPENVAEFSAVAYAFGRNLHEALEVPVGIIETAWGGTPAEAWTSRRALEAKSQLKYYVERQPRLLEEYPKEVEKYRAALARHKKAVARAKEDGKQPPPAPRPPMHPTTGSHAPAALYNGMIAPLLPYAIRGAIWYQGESNANTFERAAEYRTLFATMIANWRADWKQGDFPFLFVQLAPFMPIVQEPTDTPWARLREAQLLTSRRVPKTAMATITDLGDEKDIHPRQKEPVGARLALAARALAYGEKVTHSGPVFDRMQVDGNKAVLTFQHVGDGLVARGDRLEGFTIAGEDGKFVNAEAEIQGDRVIVHSPKVSQPTAVRYGWANYPTGNLWNQDGLPASPFRTDDAPPARGK